MKMKRKCTLLYIALAALLTACSSDGELDIPSETLTDIEILFSVNGGKVNPSSNSGSRGSVVNYYDDMKVRNIIVSAILSNKNEYFEDNLFYVDQGMDETTGEDLGYWRTVSKYYWPTLNLNFYALMPCADGNRSNSDANPFVYTTPHDNDQQTDLMYAYAKDVAPSSQEVQLNFKHALASISFSAMAKDGISVVMEGIDICNVLTKGTFYYPYNSTRELTDDMAEDTDATRLCSWELDMSSTGSLAAGIENMTLSANENNITTETGKLMMIPQTLTAWDIDPADKTPEVLDARYQTGSYLVIHCRLMSAGLYFAGSDSTYGEIYVPFSGTFEAGKQYSVKLTFGLGYNSLGEENKIKIDVDTSTIVDWSPEAINYDNRTL